MKRKGIPPLANRSYNYIYNTQAIVFVINRMKIRNLIRKNKDFLKYCELERVRKRRQSIAKLKMRRMMKGKRERKRPPENQRIKGDEHYSTRRRKGSD